MKASEKRKKKQHCLIFLAILPLAQCVALSLVNCCFAQLKLVQHCYVLCTSTPDTCLKTTDATGSFLNCPTEIGLVDESPGCVSKTSHVLQKNVVSCTTNICRHDSSVTLRFKTRTLSIFHDACHKKKKHTSWLWEVHELSLSTVILRFMLHTYSVAPNASKWRYILLSLLYRVEFLLGILPHVEPIILKEWIAKCFSPGQASF